jgi:ferredoxin
MDAAQRGGVNIRSECGGEGTCGKCVVRVQGDALPPLTDTERELLSPGQLAENWRLA